MDGLLALLGYLALFLIWCLPAIIFVLLLLLLLKFARKMNRKSIDRQKEIRSRMPEKRKERLNKRNPIKK